MPFGLHRTTNNLNRTGEQCASFFSPLQSVLLSFFVFVILDLFNAICHSVCRRSPRMCILNIRAHKHNDNLLIFTHLRARAIIWCTNETNEKRGIEIENVNAARSYQLHRRHVNFALMEYNRISLRSYLFCLTVYTFRICILLWFYFIIFFSMDRSVDILGEFAYLRCFAFQLCMCRCYVLKIGCMARIISVPFDFVRKNHHHRLSTIRQRRETRHTWYAPEPHTLIQHKTSFQEKRNRIF